MEKGIDRDDCQFCLVTFFKFCKLHDRSTWNHYHFIYCNLHLWGLDLWDAYILMGDALLWVRGWLLCLLKIWSSMRLSCKRQEESESKDVLFIVRIHDEHDCSRTFCGGDCHKGTYVTTFVHCLWFTFTCLLWSFSLQSNRIPRWKHTIVTPLCCHIVFLFGWSFLNLNHVKTTKDFHNVFAYYGKS